MGAAGAVSHNLQNYKINYINILYKAKTFENKVFYCNKWLLQRRFCAF